MKHAFRIALAGGAFVGFGLGGALLSWLVLPLCSIDLDRARRRRRCQRVVQRSFVLFHDYMRLCGLVDFDPRTARGTLPTEPCVLVTNHPTLVDVTALVAAHGELCVVAKSSLFSNPLIGPLLRLCGHIRSAPRAFAQSSDVVHQAVERLRDGHRVLLFPEGSRSTLEGLRRFHAGAFNVAFEADVPVVPIAIAAEPPGLKKGQAWYQIPARALELRLYPLPPQLPETFDSPRAMMAHVRGLIERAVP